MKIFIGADHAGFEQKEKLKQYLKDWGHTVSDMGAPEFDIEDDYPDFVNPVAKAVAKDLNSRGIVIGGTGFGEAICANRLKGVRALVFYGPILPKRAIDATGKMSADPFEIVKLSRSHNDANVLSLGIRFLSDDEIYEAVKIFLDTKFSGEQRHIRRIKKLG